MKVLSVWKINEKGHLLYGLMLDEKAMLPMEVVLVAPPEEKDGFVLCWETPLNQTDVAFGSEGTGSWGYKEDHRNKDLYLISNGQKYEFGPQFDGVGSIPDWLTTVAPPSEYHSWDVNSQTWTIKSADAARRNNDLATAARSKRNALISESDWTQMPDSPKYNDPDWMAYRQALRDISSQSGFPEYIEWPEVPDA